MKQIKKTNLRRRIFYISAVIMGATLIMCFTVIFMMNQMINKDLKVHNESMVNIAADQITDTVELPLGLIENVRKLIDKNYELNSQVVTDYLETIQDSYDYFTEIRIISLDGHIINTAPFNQGMIGDSVLYESYFMKDTIPNDELYWSDIYISNLTGMPTLSVTMKEVDYLITVDLDLETLPITLNQNRYFDEIQHISILDQWGTYIISDDFDKVKERYRFEFFDELNMGNENLTSNFNDDYKIAYSKIEDLHWYIVLEFNYENIYPKLNLFYLILFSLWVVLICIVYIYLKRYFGQINEELAYLQNRAQLIIKNSHDIDSMSFDMRFNELSLLNDDFTIMMESILVRENKIKKINDGLEDMIIERTTTLEQLEFLNSVLKRSVEEAEAANKAKSTFLSIMSHEMRTPLNGIIGFMQMLAKTKLDDEQKEILSVVNVSSKTLLELINDFLDVEKYSAGKMVFVEEPIHLEGVLQDAIDPFKALIKSKGLSFIIDFGDNLNYWVYADEMKIKQLVGNLLSNALKFTKEGYIRVNVKVENTQDSLRIDMELSDTGIGIKDKVKPYLFSPFTQADGNIAKTYGGTGLGLTICKEIVAHYNGSIEYESDYNNGTTFYIELVLNTVQENEVENTISINNKHKDETDNPDGMILVAEDNVVNQKLIRKYLEKQGVDFEIVNNGKEVLDILKEQNVSKIFMDCQMPEMNGFEATRIIRENYGDAIEIIAMTAYASKEDEKHCYEAGMNRFITKPIDLDLLEEIIGNHNRSNRKENNSIKNQFNNIVENEAKILMKKIDFDYETSYDLIQTYIEQSIMGFEEIEQYYKKNDFDQIAIKLHQLKGASAAVRFDKIKISFEKAENLVKEGRIDEALGVIRNIKAELLFKRN